MNCPRRRFLGQCGALAGLGVFGWSSPAVAVPALLSGRTKGAWRKRPDLLDPKSPAGLEVIQLTSEEIPSSHLYMEAQIFTLDSKRFVLHRSASAHGSNKNDPKHQYLLCDLENNYELLPLTEEAGATGASVSPDGRYLYYFVNETALNAGRLTLRRVKLDGTGRETIVVVDRPLPETKTQPCNIYPLSTISSDSRRIAISGFLGDGKAEGAPYGLMVFDIEQATVRVALQGPTWCNMHPQYCRSTEPDAAHDILVQENHGNDADAKGSYKRLTGGAGADIHVIRDDGSRFRDMPWGRDNNEFCQGHQCWRGRSTWAITSTSNRKAKEAQLIEAQPVAAADHAGLNAPGAKRNDLSREFPSPHFYHFATDLAGRRLITDSGPQQDGGRIYVAEFGAPGQEPLRNWRLLLNPRSSWKKEAHIHPFLSPDGTLGFFNSDESGVLQAYLVRVLA